MTSNDKITWEHLRNSARADRQAWEILLKSDINDLAAYHMQQSVEKYLKAVIMKYELTNLSPKGLGHMPIERLFKAIRLRLAKEMRDHVLSDATQHLIKLFEDQIQELTDDKKHLLWKRSLEITLTKHERRTFHGPKSLKLGQLLNVSADHPAIKAIKSYTENQEKSKSKMDSKPNILLWICGSFGMQLRMFPHMEIGRYPEIIDGKLSTDVYGECHGGCQRIQYLAGTAAFFHDDAEKILALPG